MTTTLDANQNNDPTKKTYHKTCTGAAASTASTHSTPTPLQLYGSCFCPFVQRIWIALEHLKLPYQYTEVDPYRKPDSLLALNPRGLVPALRHDEWSSHESTVLLEYLEDLRPGELLRGNAKRRADQRLWADHVNRFVVPGFYKVLQAQDGDEQVRLAGQLWEALRKVVVAGEKLEEGGRGEGGGFWAGERMMGWVDFQIAPWVVRLKRVLAPYRGWPEPEKGTRWARWVEAIEAYEAVRATTSGDELYLDSYERYAENRPNTSMVRDAIHSGGPMP